MGGRLFWGFVSWILAGVYWLADRLYGDAIFKWLCPFIPQKLSDPDGALWLITSFGPPVSLFLLGAYLFVSGRKEIELAPNVPGSMPDFSHWNSVDRFTMLQAACLWADTEPLASLKELRANPKAKARYQMLQQAVEGDRVSAFYGNPRNNIMVSVKGQTSRDAQFFRRDLKQFAESIGQRPSFLFPETDSAKEGSNSYATQLRHAAIGYRDGIVVGRLKATIDRCAAHQWDRLVTIMPEQRLHSDDLMNADKSKLSP